MRLKLRCWEAINIDKTAKERALDAKYSGLDSPDQVKRLLRDYNALKARQYDGDYDAVILLADLETAIKRASLTDRQRQAIELVLMGDLKQKDAAKRLAISRQAVALYVDYAAKKIAEIYEEWAKAGEGYSFAEWEEIAK
jgi:DNA-directed RNA polymerase specialized sigma24 family protein